MSEEYLIAAAIVIPVVMAVSFLAGYALSMSFCKKEVDRELELLNARLEHKGIKIFREGQDGR